MTRLTPAQKDYVIDACTVAVTAVAAVSIVKAIEKLNNLSGDLPKDWNDKMAAVIPAAYIGVNGGEAIAQFLISKYENLTGN